MGSYGQNRKPNFDQKKISLFQPSNLSNALILEPKGPQPPYSDVWASLGSLELDQPKKSFGADLISNQHSQRHGILSQLYTISKWLTHIEINDNICLYAKFQGNWVTHWPTLRN